MWQTLLQMLALAARLLTARLLTARLLTARLLMTRLLTARLQRLYLASLAQASQRRFSCRAYRAERPLRETQAYTYISDQVSGSYHTPAWTRSSWNITSYLRGLY